MMIARTRFVGDKRFLILRLVQVVLLGRLDGDSASSKPIASSQSRTSLRVDVAALSLILPGTLDLHQHNRADVAVGVGAEVVGLGVERVQLGQCRAKRCPPVGSLAGFKIEGDLESCPRGPVPDPSPRQAGWHCARPRVLPSARLHVLGCCRQFQDKARVEPRTGSRRRGRDRPVPLVHDDDRSDNP